MQSLKRNLMGVFVLLAVGMATARGADVEVYFSPNGGLMTAIAEEIETAEKTVLIMSYSITHPRIVRAIQAAHERGVAVRMIVTRSQESQQQSRATKLHKAGVTIKTDRKHRLMHNKVVIRDGIATTTGSANHSRTAEKENAENIVIITDKKVAELFTANFEELWEISRPFRPIPRKVIKYTAPCHSDRCFSNSPTKKEPN